jgi:hypothetical protein
MYIAFLHGYRDFLNTLYYVNRRMSHNLPGTLAFLVTPLL